MPALAANLSMMFNEVGFLDRFGAAAKAGFKGVEYLFPFDYPAAEIKSRLDANGLKQVLFNCPPGDWAKGEKGIASLPGRTAEFREGFKKALDYAAALECGMVHIMAGIPGADVAPAAAAAAYASNVAWAAEQAQAAGVKISLEMINQRDMPGFYLSSLELCADIIKGIGNPVLGMQFDIYHCQITEGDVTKRMEKFMPLICHMQLADVPARHEPGTGELNWEFLFHRIEELGYRGWIGCEYRPAGETVAGLTWRAKYAV